MEQAFWWVTSSLKSYSSGRYIQHKCVVHLVCGQWFKFVEGVIYSSIPCSTGNLWSSRVDSKAYESDGSPHGLMKLLLLKGADRPVCPARRLLRKRLIGVLSPSLNCPGKIRAEWYKSSSLFENIRRDQQSS